MWFYILLIVLAIILLLNYNQTEHFNEQSGRFCSSCKEKTFNQCLNCFNCGFCVNSNGSSGCIGASMPSGTYNNEKCDRLYLGDPYQRMQQNNQNYELEMGPKQGNRVIGTFPCGMQAPY